MTSSLNSWNGDQLLDDLLNEPKEEEDANMNTSNFSNTEEYGTISNSYTQDNNDGFYQLLGVSKTATKKEIKLAYRKKARVTHPDHNKTMNTKDAEQAFHDLTFAYKTLMDDNLRKMYDQFGKSAIDGKLNIDITKINIMGLFDQLYDEDDEKNKQKKPPIRIIMTEYNESDLVKGMKNQSFNRKEICDMCKGKGTYTHGGNCQMCYGKGFILKPVTMTVKLTNKDLNNRDVSFDGMGDILTEYPENGDLILRLRYRPKGGIIGHAQGLRAKYTKSSETEKQNTNKLLKNEITITISLKDALIGLNEQFKTANGKLVNVNIAGPIQPGSKYCIRGVNVTFNVQIPDIKKFSQLQGNCNKYNIVNNVNTLCPGFGNLMQGLHEQQQISIDKANKKAIEEIETWNCCLL